MLPWVESPAFRPPPGLPARELAWAERLHVDGAFAVVDEDILAGIDVESIFRAQEARADRGRYLDAWRDVPAVAELAAHPRVLALLAALYGRRPVPFQTLNFVAGTEQRPHSDTIHFNSLTAKWMCGVWVALEDVGDDQGPLVYYEGSHRLPEYDYRDLGLAALDNPYRLYEEAMAGFAAAFPERRFTARRGSFLVWASNLIHGGSPVLRAGSTRRSQVTHYFFEDVIPYTPLTSDQKLGRYAVRFPTDISTGGPMRASLHGTRAFYDPLPGGTYAIRLDEPRERAAYLDRYGDVRVAGADPFLHYVQHGHRERRAWGK